VVYPNPSQGIIHIFTGTATFDEVKHIRVFSAQGQMVLQTAAAGSQFELDLSSRECSAGLYTIEVHFSTSGRSEHQKLLYAH
jgi:hypothetical protein